MKSRNLNPTSHCTCFFLFFFVVKGPAADATDAPQPWGKPGMKMISFFVFQCNGVPVEWNWQGKTEVLWDKPVSVPLCPPQIPHGLTPGSNPGLGGERPATNRLSHRTTTTVRVSYTRVFREKCASVANVSRCIFVLAFMKEYVGANFRAPVYRRTGLICTDYKSSSYKVSKALWSTKLKKCY
jgi:hypothetical protein